MGHSDGCDPRMTGRCECDLDDEPETPEPDVPLRWIDAEGARLVLLADVERDNGDDADTLAALGRLRSGASKVERLGGGAQPWIRLEAIRGR